MRKDQGGQLTLAVLRTMLPRAFLFAMLALVLTISASETPHAAAAGGNGIVTIEPTSSGLPSLALDSDGNPVISYTYFSGQDLKVAHCNDLDCGNKVVASPDTTGDTGYAPSLTLDTAGNPVISYFDATNNELRVLHCGNDDCTAGNSIVTPESIGGVGLTSSIALDAAGNPIVAYSSNLSLHILHCGDPNCLSGNKIVSLLVSSPFGVSYISMKLDSSGNPVMAYYDGTLGALRLLHCDTQDCAGGTPSIATVDPAAYTDTYTSLRLDASGTPIVAFFGQAGALKIAHCNDPNCTGSDESITSPDQAAKQLLSASLVLDNAGNPVVSYNDDFNQLRLLSCNDPNCAGGDERIALLRGEGACCVGTALALDANGRPIVVYTEFGLKALHCLTTTCDQDSDGDGCPDAREQFTNQRSERIGGLRDPKNPNDYFNPSHDGMNRIDDVLLVVQAYFKDDNDANPGLPPYAAGYNPDRDRTLLGPNAWNLGPPNGLQRVDDILNAVHQYFHDCA